MKIHRHENKKKNVERKKRIHQTDAVCVCIYYYDDRMLLAGCRC